MLKHNVMILNILMMTTLQRESVNLKNLLLTSSCAVISQYLRSNEYYKNSKKYFRRKIGTKMTKISDSQRNLSSQICALLDQRLRSTK